ncbi:MAG: DUF1549 domain-containing protein, partial [Novipirellula sp. JB048]
MIVTVPLFLGLVAADRELLGQTPASPEPQAFFEKAIRPALQAHCVECHSMETEASGGLLLDSKAGWQRGGDSGAAIRPGDPDASPLMTALRYTDPNLQMPPEGKLPDDLIAHFDTWIASGAYDPREAQREVHGEPESASRGMAEAAQAHWSYRPIETPDVPVTPETRSHSPIDRFLEHRLRESGLTAAPPAELPRLIRRLHFDLTGLPPAAVTRRGRSHAAGDADPPASDAEVYERTVDELLASPHFGEAFARRWMDVVRYAESITLRGLVLPEAWRYRDYLVDAFNQDRPFDQMIREQIAGDLLDSDDLYQRQMQCIATGFLVMGNTNLEQQDKTQLEMDVIDEQLDVIGLAFLGQTIGCASCHDQKFDTIATIDYYDLAGIFSSTTELKHSNVSRWI